MFGSLDRFSDPYSTGEELEKARREAEARGRQEAEERALIDAALPPEVEATFEELIAEIPPNVRRRLEHARAYFNKEGIAPEKRLAYLADVLELLYFLKKNFSLPVSNDYAFRRYLYLSEKSGVSKADSVQWQGSDIHDPEITTKIRDIEVRAVKAARSRWRAGEALFKRFFPGEDFSPQSLERIETQIRERESSVINQLESKVPPESLASYSELIRRQILRNTFAVELTEGCSVRCTFCAFDAAPGVRNPMPFEDAVWILTRVNKRAFYYYATDPLDYRVTSSGTEYTYEDILNVSIFWRGSTPFTATAAPERSMDVFARVVDRLHRVSISKMNDRRLINKGIIERTTGGTILPTDPNLLQFWEYASQRDYPREIYHFDARSEIKQQFYSSGRQRIHSHEDGHAGGDVIGDSIACRDGIVLSPKGVKNSLRMMTTDEFPNGIAEAQVTNETLSNGAEKIEEIMRALETGAAIPINELLSSIIVSFQVMTDRRVVTTGLHAATAASQSNNKQTSTLPGKISFKAFRTLSDERQTMLEGVCQFDRVSGVIASITLGNRTISLPVPQENKESRSSLGT